MILSHRSGSRVDLNISLGEELEHVPVPRLIIQPIVENCVRHGCYDDGRVLTVNVMARSEGGALVVSIADDGRGIDGDRLIQLRSSIESKENSDVDDGEHIGLSNVHRRIALQYGRQYGLSIWSELGKGATVTIRLPLPDVN